MQVNSDRTVTIGDTTYSMESFLKTIGQVLQQLGEIPLPLPVEPVEVLAIKEQARITTDWRVSSLTYPQLLERKEAFKKKFPSSLWFLVDFIPDAR